MLYGQKGRAVCAGAPLAVPVNPTRKMELWDYEGSLSLQVHGVLCDGLYAHLPHPWETGVAVGCMQRLSTRSKMPRRPPGGGELL